MTAPLPAAYAWLASEPAPRMLVEARALYGTIEIPGRRDNPVILAWAREVGVERVYTADAIPWCGLFMALVARRADKPLPTRPLWAMNWASWGTASERPELGDVLVFRRPSGGHVGLYVGEDDQCFHVLGGNQSDAVTIARLKRDRLHACRRFFTRAAPANVRPIRLARVGAPVSEDET